MQWYTIVIDVIFPLFGLIGGAAGIIYWRENKQLKQAEVANKLAEVENKQAEAWARLFEEQKNRADEKSSKLRTLYEERDKLKEDLNAALFKVQQLQWYHCTVNGCHRRQPPHIFNRNGEELEAAAYQHSDANCATCPAHNHAQDET